MKRRLILTQAYLSMLFYDILLVSVNPLLRKKDKTSWKAVRRGSNAVYKLMKGMMK